MLDYFKIWIYDAKQIERILKNASVSKEFTSNEDGVLTCINGKLGNWKIRTLSPVCLEIAGSIHKYWNEGTNENDFSFLEAIAAIEKFCSQYDINPSLAFIKNLEFGLNLQPKIDASHIIQQIICYHNLQPLRPYNRPNCFFIEFQLGEYYLKVYDKGKQYKSLMPEIPNTLRLEVKAMKNRMLPRIKTLSDLQEISTLQVLGVKLATLLKGLIFVDDTIDLNGLNVKERELYENLANARTWRTFKGNSTSGIRKRIKRFKDLVESRGANKIYSTLATSINEKLQQLSGIKDFPFFTPNTYTVKTDTLRYCQSCKKDITHQHKNSRFCSLKYVGPVEAKKCRNMDSNPRNNLKSKIGRLNKKGVLFDILPYIFVKGYEMR